MTTVSPKKKKYGIGVYQNKLYLTEVLTKQDLFSRLMTKKNPSLLRMPFKTGQNRNDQKCK